MTNGMEATLIDGHDDLDVMGDGQYQSTLRKLVRQARGRVRKEVLAIMVAEHGNRYDPNAVSVWVQGHKVGNLGQDDAARLRPGLLALQEKHDQPIVLAGVIVGGGDHEGREMNLGVFLSYDRTEFGLSSRICRNGDTA